MKCDLFDRVVSRHSMYCRDSSAIFITSEEVFDLFGFFSLGRLISDSFACSPGNVCVGVSSTYIVDFFNISSKLSIIEKLRLCFVAMV